MRFLRRLIYASQVDRIILIATEQQDVIYRQQRLISDMELRGAQAMLELAVGWRMAMEHPDIDVSEDVDALISDLSDQVAVLQERAL